MTIPSDADPMSLTDRAEAVLYVINGHIPGSAVERRRGRDILITKGGLGVDITKLATDIAELLDMVDALPRTGDQT